MGSYWNRANKRIRINGELSFADKDKSGKKFSEQNECKVTSNDEIPSFNIR